MVIAVCDAEDVGVRVTIKLMEGVPTDDTKDECVSATSSGLEVSSDTYGDEINTSKVAKIEGLGDSDGVGGNDAAGVSTALNEIVGVCVLSGLLARIKLSVGYVVSNGSSVATISADSCAKVGSSDHTSGPVGPRGKDLLGEMNVECDGELDRALVTYGMTLSSRVGIASCA